MDKKGKTCHLSTEEWSIIKTIVITTFPWTSILFFWICFFLQISEIQGAAACRAITLLHLWSATTGRGGNSA